MRLFLLLMLMSTSYAHAMICAGVEFNPDAYYICNKDVKDANEDACRHYEKHGKTEGRRWDCEAARGGGSTVVGASVPAKTTCAGMPFNKSAYLICNPDVAAAGADACSHYAAFKNAEGRRWDCEAALPNDGSGTANVPATGKCGNDPFNISAYLICQRDIAELDVNACEHYLNNGKAEGRRWNCAAAGKLPGAFVVGGQTNVTVPVTEKCDGYDFNSKAYLICNVDVANAKSDACNHYRVIGRAVENRRWDCDAAKGVDYSSSGTTSGGTSTGGTTTGGATTGGTTTGGTSTGGTYGGTGGGSYVEDNNFTPINNDKGEAELYIQNSKIKIGVWRNHGASITHLSHPQKYNAINNSDLGRQLQSAIYSYPVPYIIPGSDTHSDWQNVGWNPVEAGDIYRNSPPVEMMAKSDDGRTIYTRTRPYQWASRLVPGEVVLEKWITLVGEENAARLHYRYRVNRADTSKYLARQQEFPCLYTVGSMYKFVGYFGENPFTGSPLDIIGVKDRSDKGQLIFPTEAWLGVIDDSNYGVGLYIPDGSMRFTKNYFSPKLDDEIVKTTDTFGYHSGYISHAPMHFVENGVYEYDSYTMVGSKEEMRDFVYRRPNKPDTRPNYQFDYDTHGFFYESGEGSAPGNHSQRPLNGTFTYYFKNGTGTLNAPERFFKAEDVPVLYLKAAFSTNMPKAAIVFVKTTEPGKPVNPVPERTVYFDIVNDGQMRVYKIPMSSNPNWRGGISSWSIFPGRWIDQSYQGKITIDYISYKEL